MFGRAAIRRMLIRWAPMLGVGLFFVNCSDQTGPEERFGHLALIPEFESRSAYIVPVDSLRITLTRSDSTTIALDTVIGLAGQDSVDLTLTVTLLAQTEAFFLAVRIFNTAGDTLFSADDVVTATSGSSTATPVPVTIVYVGVGSDADSVRITPQSASVLFGDTVLLDAIALDSVGAEIPGTPIRFLTTDSTRGTFPDDEIGALVGGSTRGSLAVIAELLTGPADTVSVLVQPIPSAVVIVSGNDQSGDVQTELTDSIVVQVNGSDGLGGVEGVSVAFSTPDGGTLTPDTVITNAQGQAASAWVLGNTVGAQTAVAEVVGAAGVQATINATAVSPVATDLAIVSGDGQTGTVGVELTDSLVVLATNITGQPVAGTTIDWAVTVNTGTPNPAASVTDANGLAATAWTLGTTTGANAITASLPVVPGPSTDVSDSAATAAEETNADAAAATAPVVTFTATGNPGPPALLTVESGDAQADTAAAVLPLPIVAKVTDSFGNPVPAVNVDFAVTGGGGSVSVATVPTDTVGLSQTVWTLGTTAGPNEVTASSSALTPVTFTATANLGAPAILSVESGDAQADTAAAVLPQPIVAKVTDSFGNPVQGVNVDFAVTGGCGSLSVATVPTDAAGLSQTVWTLGATAGANEVTASSGALTPVTFTATAGPGAPTTLSVESGDAQADTAGAVLPQPIVAKVTDAFGNPVPGVNVDFAVTGGGGSVSVATVATDAAGLAQTTWTLGTGVGANVVTASTGTLTPVLFNATASFANPAQLAFLVGPVDELMGVVFGPALQVEVKDQYGNRVTTATDDITIAIGTNPASGNLLGTPTVAAVAGVATFSDLEVDNIGAGYTLVASSGTLANGTSATFDILVSPTRRAWITVGNGNWSNPANWNPVGVPTSSDTVTIKQSGTYTVTLDVSATVEQLILGGSIGSQTLFINGQTLTVTGTSLDVNPTVCFS